MSKEKVLVVGAGMLGSAVRAASWASGYDVSIASRKASGALRLDIASDDNVKTFFKQNGPFAAVVNCAAEANVDACEANPEAARQVNALGVKRLAEACRETGAALLHISTDYVFDGAKTEPYLEEDATGPCSVYGITKLEGEHHALAIPDVSAVIRTTWIFGGARIDFVNGILDKLKRGEKPGVVDSQTASPCYAADLAGVIGTVIGSFLIPARAAGRRVNRVFHCANRGGTTRHGMAVRIARRLGLAEDLPRVSGREISTWIAVRPRHTVLSTDRIAQELGVALRPWEEALDHYIDLAGAKA